MTRHEFIQRLYYLSITITRFIIVFLEKHTKITRKILTGATLPCQYAKNTKDFFFLEREELKRGLFDLADYRTLSDLKWTLV